MATKHTAGIRRGNTPGKLLENPPAGRAAPPKQLPAAAGISADDYASVEKTIHDLRASLNIVIGFTELMLDESMGKINRQQRTSLNDILDNGRRLLGLSDTIIKRVEADHPKKKA